MNVSQPIPSSISSVSFSLLSPEEVSKLSAKRIINQNTFDALLNPVPGGLYDPALGAALGNPCSTCRLDGRSCPGHCGHIELPFRVFHCVFIDQAYRLLKGQCHFCKRLRMSAVEKDLHWCKLKLIRHGLIDKISGLEAAGVRRIRRGKRTNASQPFGWGLEDGENPYKVSGDATADAEDMEEDSNGEDNTDMAAEIMSRRRDYVKDCIKEAKRQGVELRSVHQDEAVLAARKDAIQEFKQSMVGGARQCRHCQGVSPGLRKDRARAIFQKPLSEKDRAKNAQRKIKLTANPLTELNKQLARERLKAAKEKKARAAEAIDEGVADLESSPSEDADDTGLLDAIGGETSAEDEEQGQEVERLDETGNPTVVQKDPETPKARKRRKEEAEARMQKYINAEEIYASLVFLFQHEKDILHLVYQMAADGPEPTADMFFVRNLIVPPNKFRPESKTGQDEVSEPPEHEAYKRILALNSDIWQIRRELQGQSDETRSRLRTFDDLNRSWINLQEAVNGLFDSDKSGVRGMAALRIPDGVKQRLEKKEGMFRMNIMGKRVNFAARSVISPDPNIETNEIGIPPVFATTLTYPEPVTSFTFDYLKQCVMNGPRKWPGANAVEYENGQVVSLARKTEDERIGIANLLMAPSATGLLGARPKRVHRHLASGDMVIMNRQPTLHKPSMMCHRAKILHGEKTIRMHYANCNTYNADFDGDEMNMHYPQNETARAEMMDIADTDHQYLSATAGKPLRGLIQDHVSQATWLTCVGMLFTRQEYNELLYSCLRPEHKHIEGDRIYTVEPAIMKPAQRWTGKQVITTVLENIKPLTHAPLSFESPSQIDGERWGEKEESRVRVVEGEMLTGVLDKKQIGPSTGGLTHSVYEVYGAWKAGQLLSILGRLLTHMLNKRAFSCGIEDLLLTDKGNATRAEQLTGSETVGMDVASKYVSLAAQRPTTDSPELLKRLEKVLRDDEKQHNLDLLMNTSTAALTGNIWKACVPSGLHKPFPNNQMQTMTISGAKGSNVNASQISCNLGQQVLEGRRVPVMVSGKTLPCFRPFETSIRAGGYIIDRFLTGIRPQEYFFQLMAGREGLIDTAVKTAKSGYLQRCVIKGLEGCHAGYDTSVRDADGTMIQATYGEDGLEVTKSQKLNDFTFLSKNFLSMFAEHQVREYGPLVLNDEPSEYMKKTRKAVGKADDGLPQIDTALQRYAPHANVGSTSEKFHEAARKYIADNPDKTIREKGSKDLEAVVSKRYFQQVLNMKYNRSVVEPGEAVGVVAGQSIGEPSTQMTLNTFHLAGFAAKNVTLGIPRLREILMTASKTIKKPTMTLYPIPELKEADCQRFAKSISRLSLSQLIDKTSVQESIGGETIENRRIYDVHIEFFPAEEYTKEYAINVSDVAEKLEKVFVKVLIRKMKADIKKRAQDKSLEIGVSAGRDRDEAARPEADNEGGDSDEEAGGDDDATDAKRKANLDEGMTYDDPDESEAEVEREGERQAADEVQESADEDEGYVGSEDMSGDESRAQPPKDAASAGDTPAPSKYQLSRKAIGTPKSKSKSKSKPTLETKAKPSISSKNRQDRAISNNEELTRFTFTPNTGTTASSTCTLRIEFPITTPKILALNSVHFAASQTLVQEIPGLGSAQHTRERPLEKDDAKKGRHLIVTEGQNLPAIRHLQHVLNPHKTATNDIFAFLTHYGVAAARDLIIAELGTVFSGHNIDVDIRHLMLVADYMTRAGGFSPFSRAGLATKASPLAKMSFETTVRFLADAVMEGEREGLEGPSSRIAVGRRGNMGSGMCDVLMPVAVGDGAGTQ